MLLEGAVVLFPAIEGLVAEETCDVVGVAGERLEDEAGLGHLQTVHMVKNASCFEILEASGERERTSAGLIDLCGHDSVFGARDVAAVDALRFVTRCGPWKDARRFS